MLGSILGSVTWKQSQITVIGTIINGGLGVLFYIVLARFLGPYSFGLLTVSVATLTLIADIVDFGTNTGLVRFVSSNLAVDKERAYKFLKLSLEIKLITWVGTFFIIFLLSPLLATQVFHKVELILPLRLVAFGVGGALLFTFATSMLQAYQKYFFWSVVNIATNFLRLVLILVLSYYLALNVKSSLLVYIILPLFGFFITLFLVPARKILQSKSEFSLSKELFKYNIPVAIFTIIAAFSARLDTFLNASLLSARDVGIYGAASQLVQVVPQLVAALGIVAAPKFSSFRSNEQMIVYLKKFQLLVTGMCLLGVLSIPVSIKLIPLMFGSQFQEAIFPFVFLFLAMLVFLFSVPVHISVIFYFARPDVFIWVSIIHLMIIGGLGYLLISNYGVIGASVTVLVGTTFNFLYPLVWLIYKLRRG